MAYAKKLIKKNKATIARLSKNEDETNATCSIIQAYVTEPPSEENDYILRAIYIGQECPIRLICVTYNIFSNIVFSSQWERICSWIAVTLWQFVEIDWVIIISFICRGIQWQVPAL